MAFVEWDEKYSVGIASVDEQHVMLIEIINDLFDACRQDKTFVDEAFRIAIKKAIDYVIFHFAHEEKLQLESSYPDYATHKEQHEDFIKTIIRSVDDYKSGKRSVPNNFVRHLLDWLLEHIAISDKAFGMYYCRKQNV
jgi:hemerythrin